MMVMVIQVSVLSVVLQTLGHHESQHDHDHNPPHKHLENLEHLEVHVI